LPVIVFVHGGGWKEGTSNIPLYDGANLALRGSVVVTLNYRLGPLGFLALRGLAAERGGTTGNYGLLDQIAALEWVQENAAAFGGDPARVLFWGQSAGAWSALIHATSPRSAGLFSRAFSDSGGPYVRGLERATADGVVYADALGCPAVPGRIECLRAKSDEEIVMPAPSGGWSPVIDGIVIEEPIMAALEAGHHVDIPFLVLNTANEFTRMEANPPVDSIASAADYEAAIAQRFGDGAEAVLAQYPVLSFATPWDAYLAVLNDANMSCANRRITRALAATQTAPVFRTVWDHIDSGGALQHLGATHGADLRYWFANFGGMFEPTDEELALSDAMGSFLTSFAATGDPDRTGADGWPAHDAATDALLLLDVDLTTIDGYRTAACDFWDGLAPGLGD
jgi:para-nitrobenzyl esterase